MLKDPDSFHKLLHLLTDYTIDYLLAQYHSGANGVQLFESWAQMLPYHQFKEFSLPYQERIVSTLKSYDIPVILFARGSSLLSQELAALKPTAISVDWNGDLKKIRNSLGSSIVLQGNLDPEVLLCSPMLSEERSKKLSLQ